MSHDLNFKSRSKNCFVYTVGGVVMLFLTALASSCGSEPPVNDLSCPGCNVLFLNIDLLRSDYVGLLDSRSRHSPHIDKFFRNAIVFEQASAPSGKTYVSNAAVLSAMEGLAMPEIKNRAYFRTRPYRNIAEELTDAGYDTIDLNWGMGVAGGAVFDRGFRQIVEFEVPPVDETDPPAKQPFRYYVSLMILMQLINKESDRPYFMLYRQQSLHDSYWYPREYREVFAPDRKDSSGEKLPELREVRHTAYAEQVEFTDRGLGVLFSLLENGSLNNTIVVLYANHGDQLGDRGIFKHGVLYQSCVHVPLLIRHPKINRQIRINTPISLIDLGPTILDMLGIKVRDEMAGTSLVPLIRGQRYARTYIFGKDVQERYVRKGNWKLIAGINRTELYDIDKDPGETKDIALERPDVVDELRAVLQAKEIEVSKLVGIPPDKLYDF